MASASPSRISAGPGWSGHTETRPEAAQSTLAPNATASPFHSGGSASRLIGRFAWPRRSSGALGGSSARCLVVYRHKRKAAAVTYVVVLRSSLIQALVCGLVFAVLGFSRTALVSAILITLVAVWLGFLCAQLVACRRKPSARVTTVMTVVAGIVLGSASAFAFCWAIEVYPLPPFLVVGALVGLALAQMNVRAWRNHGLAHGLNRRKRDNGYDEAEGEQEPQSQHERVAGVAGPAYREPRHRPR